MKAVILKTKRLVITPMTVEELEKTIENTADEGLSAAYNEMLSSCRAHPDETIWYAPWKMCDKNSPDVVIGEIGFMGPAQKGEVVIGYGTEEQFRGKGYMTEAVRAVVDWAFSQENIYVVSAEAEDSNEPSKKVLLKNGFKTDGQGVEATRYVLEKPDSAYIGVFMCLGVGVGLCFGVGFGMCMGMCIGLALGAALDANERKKREEVLGKKKKDDKNEK